MSWWRRDLILFHIWRNLLSISAFQCCCEVKCKGKYRESVTKASVLLPEISLGGKKRVLEIQAGSAPRKKSRAHRMTQAHSYTVWQVLDAPNFFHMSRSPLLCTQNPWETAAQPLCVGSVTVPSAFLSAQNSCRNCYPDQAVWHQYTLDRYPKSSFSAQAKLLDRDKGHVKTKQTGYTTAQVLMPQQRIMGKHTKVTASQNASLELSLLKHPHSFIHYSIFPEQRF